MLVVGVWCLVVLSWWVGGKTYTRMDGGLGEEKMVGHGARVHLWLAWGKGTLVVALAQGVCAKLWATTTEPRVCHTPSKAMEW